MDRKEIPVLLLTGYLGSGKTTLLNRILRNEKGIRFAVIVNDLGEVNIDASLIQKGGVVGKKDGDGDLVALQNGCICCTLQTDLIDQLTQLASSGKFDYIVIEASGICDPAPIAQTICAMAGMDNANTPGAVIPRLDCIVTVVDALRMQSEFDCGEGLKNRPKGEEDIESLVIQQIEFCNVILLNKISEVTPEEAGRIRAIIRAIQPKAKIIDCNYADVDFDEILGTGMFDFEEVATSATWVREIEGHHDHDEDDEDDDDHDDDDHDDHHHSHHSHHSHSSQDSQDSQDSPTTIPKTVPAATATTITTTAATPRNTASRLWSTTAAPVSTSTSSTGLSPHPGPVTSSAQRVCCISATTATCRSSSSRPVCRNS